MKFKLWRAWCLALPLSAPGTVAAAGIYDEPKNLKVLPADITPQELRHTMRGFAFDLGMNCENCHVGEAGQPLESFDFAADDKDMKATARLMLRMLAEINDRQLAALNRAPDERITVRCATCHRGQSKPLLIADALTLAYREGGAPATVARYRTLKADFFGSDSFDFTEQPRLEFARGLAAHADVDGGIAFLHELRDEHGASFMTDLTLADLYLAAGKREQAIASLKAAHSRAPPALQELILKKLEGLEGTAGSGN